MIGSLGGVKGEERRVLEVELVDGLGPSRYGIPDFGARRLSTSDYAARAINALHELSCGSSRLRRSAETTCQSQTVAPVEG